MIETVIPGFKTLQLEHLVLDYNGTLSCDGFLIDGVAAQLRSLSGGLHIHVVTADTFGQAQKQLAGLACRLELLGVENQAEAKLAYITRLGCEKTVAVGNGRNDRHMLRSAALGIAVVQTETAAAETLMAADVVAPGIQQALDLLSNPLRLIATLRA